MSRQKIPLILTFDDNIVMQAGVSITSLLNNARSNVFYEIHVLYIELNKNSQKEILRLTAIYDNVSIDFVDCTEYFSAGYEVRNITSTAYLRLLIPKLFRERYSKVIYSDVDVIFREDLSEIFDFDLGDNAIAGIKADGVRRDYKDEMGFTTDYINSGFLLIDIDKITDDEVIKSVELAKTSKYLFQDQDIINVIYKNRINSNVSPRWGFSPNKVKGILIPDKTIEFYFSQTDINELDCSHGILHYAGPKPWNTHIELGDVWWEVYRSSIYYNRNYYINYQTRINRVLTLKEIFDWSYKNLKKNILKKIRS